MYKRVMPLQPGVPRVPPLPHVAFVSMCAFAMSACSSTATVMRSGGPDYEGKISGSDADALYVQATNGLSYKVPRREIYGIDHPGNVTMGVGLATFGLGALMFGTSFNGSEDDRDVRGIGIGYAVTGLLVAAIGGAFYFRSTAAAKHFEDARPLPVATPMSWPPVVPLPAPKTPASQVSPPP